MPASAGYILVWTVVSRQRIARNTHMRNFRSKMKEHMHSYVAFLRRCGSRMHPRDMREAKRLELQIWQAKSACTIKACKERQGAAGAFSMAGDERMHYRCLELRATRGCRDRCHGERGRKRQRGMRSATRSCWSHAMAGEGAPICNRCIELRIPIPQSN